MAFENLTNLLDRRVTLQKPTDDREALSNEPETDFTTVISGLPAGRTQKDSGGKEDLEGAAVRSLMGVDWQVRYFGTTHPKANWRLIDEYGTTHNIVSPPIEIGRRKGWILKTEVVQ